MKLSQQTSDAVSILVYCESSDGHLIKVREIADELQMTKNMALKLSNILSQKGLVKTVRGPAGGIQLSDVAKSATLRDIVRKLETPSVNRKKKKRLAPLDQYFDEAFEAFLSVLDQHCLADLAKTKRASRPRPKPVKRKSSQTRKEAKSMGLFGHCEESLPIDDKITSPN